MKFNASRHISSPSTAVYYTSLHFKCDVYLNYKTLFIQRKLPSINFRVSDPCLKMDCPTYNSHVLRVGYNWSDLAEAAAAKVIKLAYTLWW